MKQKVLNILAVLVLCVLLFNPTTSHALILIEGTGALGAYTGSLSYSFTNATTAELEFVLTNTSPASNGGFLTAFVFNNPFSYISDVSLSSTDLDFGLLGANLFDNGINGAPYGQFDIGASTGGGFLGGGNPSLGIGVGATETFTFSLTGINLNTLTEQLFLEELSVPPGAGEGVESFVARFRGFEDDGSDKVPLDDTNNVIPEPSSILLFGFGAIGMALRKKRKV